MKIIILGDGLLGSEIIKQTKWDYISRKKDKIDFINPSSYIAFLEKYDTVLNCIAHTDTYSNDKQKHWDINYKGLVELVDYCKMSNKKLIHISTDYIYANSSPLSSEEDIPVHQQNWYGYTKLLGDAYVQLKLNNYLLIRESHKPYPFPYKTAWSDQHTNGDYVNVIADLIIKLINNNSKGVFNVGTKEKTWFNHTKNEFKTTPSTKTKEAPFDITMNIEKLNNELKNISK